VLLIVDQAIARLQSHPDADVRDALQALLEGIDAVHRAGLTHLVQAVHGMAGDAFLNRLTADPAIRLLLMSYNLVAVDRRLQAEEALDTVRGHLHDHGLDVEIRDVVGGVVHARLHWHRAAAEVTEASAAAAQRDIESALLEHFVGFQELVLGERRAESGPLPFVSLEALKRASRPSYHDAFETEALADGGLKAAEIHGVPVLFAAVDGDVYAVRNRCGDSPLPLEFSALSGPELRCSWHGCRYDVRSGRRVDGDPGSIQVFPVAIDGGRVRVALGVRCGDGS
jgi:nitrite reductase/ring-hydroxylating ferredoxin subunit